MWNLLSAVALLRFLPDFFFIKLFLISFWIHSPFPRPPSRDSCICAASKLGVCDVPCHSIASASLLHKRIVFCYWFFAFHQLFTNNAQLTISRQTNTRMKQTIFGSPQISPATMVAVAVAVAEKFSVFSSFSHNGFYTHVQLFAWAILRHFLYKIISKT